MFLCRGLRSDVQKRSFTELELELFAHTKARSCSLDIGIGDLHQETSSKPQNNEEGAYYLRGIIRLRGETTDGVMELRPDWWLLNSGWASTSRP